MRNDIAHISRHTHHTISFFMSSQLPFDNIIRSEDLLYALIISSLKTERRGYIFRNPSKVRQHFLSCAVCQQLSRSTILSISFSSLLQDRNIVRFDHTHYSKDTLVCSSTDTNLGIRIFVLPIFPRNPWLTRHPTILKHSTAQSRTVIGILHEYPVS